jgi:hypothetical protein
MCHVTSGPRQPQQIYGKAEGGASWRLECEVRITLYAESVSLALKVERNIAHECYGYRSMTESSFPGDHKHAHLYDSIASYRNSTIKSNILHYYEPEQVSQYCIWVGWPLIFV